MTETYILGGYTKGRNTGISRIQFDPTTASFQEASLIARLNQPTYVTQSDDGRYLFTLHREDSGAGVVAFKRQGEDWIELSRCLNTQIPGCHLTYHQASQTLFVANYHEGSLDSYHLDHDELIAFERHEHLGSSVHPNQASAHLHFVGLSPDQSHLFTCDLGSDRLYLYALHPHTGTLTLAHTVICPPGTGPRHLVFHPHAPYVYVIGELSNHLLTYQITADGSLSLVNEIDIIDSSLQANAAGAAIRISQDGHYLYTSTRFHNVLCVFSLVLPDKPEKIQEIASGGDIPRDFVLNQTQDYVLVAHQDSDQLAVFRRDISSGHLHFLQATTLAPECVCLTPA